MLSFSKGGAVVSRFRPTDVLEGMLAMLENKQRNKAVICEREFSGHVEFRGVESELRQIFWNLLNNSLDAVPSGGRIKLRVSPSRRNGGVPGVRVTVADNGSGIAADHMPHLFELFFTTKKTGNGRAFVLNIKRNVSKGNSSFGTKLFASKLPDWIGQELMGRFRGVLHEDAVRTALNNLAPNL
jgi:signal transduction histidine kinase